MLSSCKNLRFCFRRAEKWSIIFSVRGFAPLLWKALCGHPCSQWHALPCMLLTDNSYCRWWRQPWPRTSIAAGAIHDEYSMSVASNYEYSEKHAAAITKHSIWYSWIQANTIRIQSVKMLMYPAVKIHRLNSASMVKLWTSSSWVTRRKFLTSPLFKYTYLFVTTLDALNQSGLRIRYLITSAVLCIHSPVSRST